MTRKATKEEKAATEEQAARAAWRKEQDAIELAGRDAQFEKMRRVAEERDGNTSDE